ncbi:MAG: TM0996/MTH895 family glutaredoxin-like protein [Actinobacteria bacterium]|mgnify:CR=1 FL=1|nr:TM0996/MTH895 family glutaredoxin-like protein [Actinomycetota bacterium]
MIIKILGPGCANCQRLEHNTTQALTDLGVEATVEKVTDYSDIVSYGVMKTPGLVVDERVLVSGRVPSSAELGQLLTSAISPS